MSSLTHYELSATLSEYAGNHERELTYWVFGAYDDSYSSGFADRPHASAMAWAYDATSAAPGFLQMVAHEEYGMVWQDLDPQNSNTVIWKLAERPESAQWDALRAVLKSYEGARVFVITLTRVDTTYTDEVMETL